MEADIQPPAGGAGQRATRDRARDVRLVLAGIIAALLIWFAVANTQKVEIHFWVATAHASLISVIIVSAALGILLAVLVSYQRRRARSRKGA